MINPEMLHPIFKGNPDSSSPENRRKITEQEENFLIEKLGLVRSWACIGGQMIKYPKKEDAPDGYLKEFEVPVIPGGVVRAGADVLKSYNGNVFVYLNLLSESGSIRFCYFFANNSGEGVGFRFSIADKEDNDTYIVRGSTLGEMNKRDYDMVIEMSGYFIGSARAIVLPRETQAEI